MWLWPRLLALVFFVLAFVPLLVLQLAIRADRKTENGTCGVFIYRTLGGGSFENFWRRLEEVVVDVREVCKILNMSRPC